MSISVYRDVWCDVCGTWEEAATSVTAKRARKIARQYGWKVQLRGGLDVCPDCAASGKIPTKALGES